MKKSISKNGVIQLFQPVNLRLQSTANNVNTFFVKYLSISCLTISGANMYKIR